METVYLTKEKLTELLGIIAKENNLIAPVKRGQNSFAFERIDDPAKIEVNYVRSILPPKQAIWPQRQNFLDFSISEQKASPILENKPFVVFGVHPCDLSGIEQLDWAMALNNYRDPHYFTRRESAVIIGIDCKPDKWCFCDSIGTIYSRGGADLFLTPADGGFVVEVLSEKGRKLLSEKSSVRQTTEQQLKETEAWRKDKKASMICKLNGPVEELPALLEKNYENNIWQETAERCYSCGTCTIVCPTCFCFDVKDEVNLPLTAGTRQRKWDSCQYLDFAVVAGNHNFRLRRQSRVRHRWFRKFKYLFEKYGKPFCIGCGRCSQGCTAQISLTEVINDIFPCGKTGAAK